MQTSTEIKEPKMQRKISVILESDRIIFCTFCESISDFTQKQSPTDGQGEGDSETQYAALRSPCMLAQRSNELLRTEFVGTFVRPQRPISTIWTYYTLDLTLRIDNDCCMQL